VHATQTRYARNALAALATLYFLFFFVGRGGFGAIVR